MPSILNKDSSIANFEDAADLLLKNKQVFLNEKK